MGVGATGIWHWYYVQASMLKALVQSDAVDGYGYMCPCLMPDPYPMVESMEEPT